MTDMSLLQDSGMAHPLVWGLAAVVAVLLAATCCLCLRLRRARRHTHEKTQEIQEMRRQEAIGTLAGGIAHDFNNILGSIMGFGALLEEDLNAHPEQQEMARQIMTAARRGQGIVLQLMNYSRKSRNENERKEGRDPVSLDAVVRENIVLLRPSIRSSTRMMYENHAEDNIVTADSTQLGQVIVNLCINADHAIGVKAGMISLALGDTILAEGLGGGNGDVLVSGGEGAGESVQIVNGSLPPGAYLSLSVTDDGEGMTREVAERIFDPFFTTKDVNVGTGLGLAAIQGIVLSHGGAITVKSERFRGTTFTLLFPRQDTAAQAPAGRPAERASL